MVSQTCCIRPEGSYLFWDGPFLHFVILILRTYCATSLHTNMIIMLRCLSHCGSMLCYKMPGVYHSHTFCSAIRTKIFQEDIETLRKTGTMKLSVMIAAAFAFIAVTAPIAAGMYAFTFFYNLAWVRHPVYYNTKIRVACDETFFTMASRSWQMRLRGSFISFIVLFSGRVAGESINPQAKIWFGGKNADSRVSNVDSQAKQNRIKKAYKMFVLCTIYKICPKLITEYYM